MVACYALGGLRGREGRGGAVRGLWRRTAAFMVRGGPVGVMGGCGGDNGGMWGAYGGTWVVIGGDMGYMGVMGGNRVNGGQWGLLEGGMGGCGR